MIFWKAFVDADSLTNWENADLNIRGLQGVFVTQGFHTRI